MVGPFSEKRLYSFYLLFLCLFTLCFFISSCVPPKKMAKKTVSTERHVEKRKPISRVKKEERAIRKHFAEAEREERMRYVGSAVCAHCHPGYAEIGKSRHRDVFEKEKFDKRGCEFSGCHGKGSLHAKNTRANGTINTFSKMSIEELNLKCLTCHKKKKYRKWYDSNEHAQNKVPCSLCHRVHATRKDALLVMYEPKLCFECHAPVAEMFRKKYTHPLESGRVICKNCHGVHEEFMLSKDTKGAVRVCVTCHKTSIMNTKYSHAPVFRSCVNCHTPHGSNIKGQLKRKLPDLCEACHNVKSHRTAIKGRNCLACHDYIHGSFNRLLSSSIVSQ